MTAHSRRRKLTKRHKKQEESSKTQKFKDALQIFKRTGTNAESKEKTDD